MLPMPTWMKVPQLKSDLIGRMNHRLFIIIFIHWSNAKPNSILSHLLQQPDHKSCTNNNFIVMSLCFAPLHQSLPYTGSTTTTVLITEFDRNVRLFLIHTLARTLTSIKLCTWYLVVVPLDKGCALMVAYNYYVSSPHYLCTGILGLFSSWIW